jgi:hypothetical protein
MKNVRKRPRKQLYQLVERLVILNEMEMYPQEAGKTNAGFARRGDVRRWIQPDGIERSRRPDHEPTANGQKPGASS